jgi:uncharacterized Zn-finger protein
MSSRVDPKYETKLECRVCQSEHDHVADLNTHLLEIHKTRRFTCDLCPVTFQRDSELRRHIDGVHLGLRLHTCDLCDDAFTKKGNLTRHIASVHNNAKPYECNDCGDVWMPNSDLNRFR